MPAERRAWRVIVADDHPAVRAGLRLALADRGIEVVGEATNGAEAVRLGVEHEPDVVLMDVTMPVLDGIEATRLLREQRPGVRVVVLSMHAETAVAARALRAGACGYLVKDADIDEVVEAIELAASDVAVSPGVAASMLAQWHPPAPGIEALSAREEEVLQLVANGLSPAEVAERLFISAKTVKNHLASIYQKLDARDRTQAVLQGLRLGIVRLG